MKERSYTAAGGVVLDAGDRVLLIVRDVIRADKPIHEVRLPKGHVEPGETDVEAALREVCEETGYCGLTVLADLNTRLTTFESRDELVRRTEHYYLMRVTDAEPGAPHFDTSNADEARFLPQWAPSLEAAETALTYEPEREFIRRALNKAKAP